MNIFDVIGKIAGKQVVRVIAGGSNGSIIVLKIGNQEFSISIKCVWRLEHKGRVIAGWNESNDAIKGNLTIQAKALTGEMIERIEISNLYDMKVYFLGDKILNVFCDVTPNYEPHSYDENWVISDIIENISYVASKNFEILTRPYE